MGTPHYASSEQCDEERGEATRQLREGHSGRRVTTWLRRALGTQQASGFLLMTLDGKLSREQRLLKER